MASGSDRFQELHQEGHARQRQRIDQMTPWERMEEAYRLFALVREQAGEPGEEG